MDVSRRSAESLIQYTIASKAFYEPLHLREINECDFYKTINTAKPQDWVVHRHDIWIHCTPKKYLLPKQGWKIHISALKENALKILITASRELWRRNIPFKFAADQKLLAIINSKRYPRGGSGKFITIYPKNIDEFLEILNTLYPLLVSYAGPYILTDRRFKDCTVLYYRYGGITGEFEMDTQGRKVFYLTSPSGERVVDDRAALFKLPSWVSDPVLNSQGEAEVNKKDTSRSLKCGRYCVKVALSHSSAGGVYLAEDRFSGEDVIIKEARPYVGDIYAQSTMLLAKEYRILRALAHEGIAPEPLDYFKEWEHYYLVQKKISAKTLRSFLAERHIALRVKPSVAAVKEFKESILTVFAGFAEAIEKVHKNKIVLGDRSLYNVLIDDTLRVYLIDFESSYEEGVDPAIPISTPGFAPPFDQNHSLIREDDYFAFGACLFAALLPVNSIMQIDETAIERFSRELVVDLMLGAGFADEMLKMLSREKEKRPKPSDVVVRLRKIEVNFNENCDEVLCLDAIGKCKEHSNRILDYILANATPNRNDRIFPADPSVYDTNPYNIAFGIAGIVHVLQRCGREIPEYAIDRLASGARKDNNFSAPSLYYGASGVAWVLYDLGLDSEANALMHKCRNELEAFRHFGLFGGLAGWGLANLKAYCHSEDKVYLIRAIEIGERLVNSSIADEDSIFWQSDEKIFCGYGHGSAGISLFLLYLAIKSGDDKFLVMGKKALEFDLKNKVNNMDGMPTWRMALNSNVAVPYLEYGTAGILSVVARYWRVSRDQKYLDLICDAAWDLNRKYAINPGLFFGLAGLGETLLDLSTFLPDSSHVYSEWAMKVASGIKLFLIEKPDGLAAPGVELLRISCDYSTGGAGLASFLSRIAEPAPSGFLLDSLIS